MAELGGDLGGLTSQATVGETDDCVPRGLHLGVPGPVALEGGSVTVELEAVSLDHQLLIGPGGIDLATEDADIGLWRGKPVSLAKAHDSILERRFGARRPNIVHETTKGLEAAAAAASGIDLLQCADVQEIESVRLLERPGECLLVANFSDVEESSSNGRDRYFVDDGLLVSMHTAFVNDDAVSGPATGRKDFRRAPPNQTPQRSRAPVAEQRAITTGQHGGGPLAPLIHPISTQGVDAAMHSV